MAGEEMPVCCLQVSELAAQVAAMQSVLKEHAAASSENRQLRQTLVSKDAEINTLRVCSFLNASGLIFTVSVLEWCVAPGGYVAECLLAFCCALLAIGACFASAHTVRRRLCLWFAASGGPSFMLLYMHLHVLLQVTVC